MKYVGKCLCETVQFEISGEFENFFLCHCERCRKDTGSAHAANLFSNTATLRWIVGEENIQTFNYQSDGHIKSFCKTCGSALPNMQFDGTLLVVPAGSLDTQVHMRPQGHIFLAHKATWDKELSTVPGYAYLPTTDQNQKED
mgnify:FL=1